MSKVYINGLVKYMNQVRQYMVHGVSRTERTRIAEEIKATIQNVNKICGRYHIQPQELPQPTYRAYSYLVSINPNDIPVNNEFKPKADQEVRIKNVLSFCNAVHSQLNEVALNGRNSSLLIDVLSGKIQKETGRIESICRKQGLTTNGLPLQSYKAYQWLKLLSVRANLESHVNTHQILMQNIIARQRNGWWRNKKLEIKIFYISPLYTASVNHYITRVSLHEGFIGAPEEVLNTIADVVVNGKRNNYVGLIRRYSESEAFKEISMRARKGVSQDLQAAIQGQYFNLEQVYQRVSEKYFNGTLGKPNLTWNRQLTRRKLGHYSADTDTVMISIALDNPDTPRFLIDYVMYHELLHKKIGFVQRANKRYAHTAEFHAQEKKFAQYKAVKEYLKKESINNKQPSYEHKKQ